MVSNIVLFSVVLSVIVLKAKCDGFYNDGDEITYDTDDEIKYEIGE